MIRRTRRILTLCVAAVLTPAAGLAALIGWQALRDHSLLPFCKAAKSGISVDTLLDLERQNGVDDSYVVQAGSPRHIDQRHSHRLEFRSQWFDPDFACAIDHDGRVVTNVVLLALQESSGG